jgi:hypothetical protein
MNPPDETQSNIYSTVPPTERINLPDNTPPNETQTHDPTATPTNNTNPQEVIHSNHSKLNSPDPTCSNHLKTTTTGCPKLEFPSPHSLNLPRATNLLQAESFPRPGQKFLDPTASIDLQPYPLVKYPGRQPKGVWTPTKIEMQHEIQEALDFIKKYNYPGTICYHFPLFVVDPDLSHPCN